MHWKGTPSHVLAPWVPRIAIPGFFARLALDMMHIEVVSHNGQMKDESVVSGRIEKAAKMWERGVLC